MKLSCILLISILITLTSATFVSDCLDGHNVFRKNYKVNNLTWSNSLAASAQNWANYMATNRRLKHSGTSGVGENIASRSQNGYTGVRDMVVKQWGGEQRYFVQGYKFPSCSTTGNWEDIGHFTQMIWRQTTKVGCGIATGGKTIYLACQYSSPGNWLNEYVY